VLDKKWIELAKNRSQGLKSGTIKAVPCEEVFDKIWQRFSS